MTKHVPGPAEGDDVSFSYLWNQREKSTRGPKPAFRLEQVVRAGIQIADKDGLSALTMALVAENLGVTVMALYRYVPGKEVLVDLMGDHVMQRPPKPTGVSWRADISAWSRAILAMMRRHPWLLEIVRVRPVAGPNWARWFDTGLQSLQGLPFSTDEKTALLLLVDGYSRAAADLLVGAKVSQEWTNNFGRMLRMITGDPRYPALNAMLATGHVDQPAMDLIGRIEFGLERILDGIEVSLKAER